MSEKRTPAVIDWYRTPLPKDVFKQLHERSDLKAWLQTGGFLAIVLCTGGLAFWSWWHDWHWAATVALVFLHGMVSHFHINGMHELGHGTVFRTKALNAFFVRVVSFLGWLNFETFNASHQRHHRYTLHDPDDQEVVLPVKLMVRHFFEQGFFNYKGFWWTMKYFGRIARGRFVSPWELVCYPPDQPDLRRAPVRWARFVLGGHLVIAVVSLATGLWIIPILVTLATFIGGWLFFLCNNTQHIGLQDKVPDFRLCCRTILINPVVRFLYWQMNFHTEHHMYAAVPCYHLKRLHAAIAHDMPPCPRGLVATWRHIIGILRRQQTEPGYCYTAPLPASSPAAR
ncbi:MAG: fatty acid desaturase [Opitutaceae bacterium]|nr:fatty acid desaturase [Opitutaceae bacterium]